MASPRERRIRVAYLPASLNPGGAERQMLALAERLPRDRFDVEFLVLSGSGLYDDRAVAATIPVRHVGQPPDAHASRISRVWHRSSKILRYVSLVRRGRYDVVDAWLYPADVLAAVMKPMTQTPVVITGRRNVDPQQAFGPLEGVVSRLTGRLTDVIVANSAAAAEHAIRSGADSAKVRVIRNGVVIPPPATAVDIAEARSGMGVIDPDCLVIGCVANLLPVKRHDRLLEAFGEVARDARGVRLVLVGEGPQRESLERQVRRYGLDELVRLQGSVPEPRLLYAGFDLVVQASEREGLPNALLEAAAAGRPVIATAAGGTAEIVVDELTGLLVPVDDNDALVTGLRRLIREPALRTRLGERAREHVAQRFGMDRFVSEFASLYEDAVHSRLRPH